MQLPPHLPRPSKRLHPQSRRLNHGITRATFPAPPLKETLALPNHKLPLRQRATRILRRLDRAPSGPHALVLDRLASLAPGVDAICAADTTCGLDGRLRRERAGAGAGRVIEEEGLGGRGQARWMEAHGGEVGAAVGGEFEAEFEAEGSERWLLGLLLLLLLLLLGKGTAFACWCSDV